jgi:hypothetical protein
VERQRIELERRSLKISLYESENGGAKSGARRERRRGVLRRHLAKEPTCLLVPAVIGGQVTEQIQGG